MPGEKSSPVLARRVTGRNVSALLLVFLSAIWSAPSHAVVGGERIRMSMMISHYVVGIKFEGTDGKLKICAGGIIGPQMVLTAAHCVPKNLKSMRIIVGDSLDESRAVAVLPVTAARVHPQYQSAEDVLAFHNDYDIAVVRTKDPLPNATRHLQLALSYYTIDFLPTVYVIGYGLTDKDGKKTSSEFLMSAVGKRHADDTDERRVRIDQTSGAGVCKGDSGGPMVVENANGWIIMGVAATVHNATDGPLCNGDSYFISVSNMKHWIMKQSFELMQVYR